MDMKDHADDLARRRARAAQMSGDAAVARQHAAGNALIDVAIDRPATRPTLVRALEMATSKRVERPWRTHGVMPV
jgi:acetyl-CoA carboxylase carboxyltransferase component